MISNSRFVAMVSTLARMLGALLISAVMAGCGATLAIDDSTQQPSATSTALQRLGIPSSFPADNLIQVQLDTDAVDLDSLFNITMKDEFIFANIMRDGKVNWLTIQLPDGHVSGPGFTQSPNQQAVSAQRYTIRARGGEPGVSDQLFIYDWLENQERELVKGRFNWPHLDGNRVVWSQPQGGAGNIVGYDLETQKNFVVSDGSGLHYVGYPTVSGDWVGYLGRGITQTEREFDLYVHNLVTSETLRLGTVPNPDSAGWNHFDISHNRVAWIDRDYKANANAVYVYDLNLRQKRVVNDLQAENRAGCMAVDLKLAGDTVIWNCTGRHAFELVNNVRFELPLFPPSGVREVANILYSDKWLVWIARPLDTQELCLFAVPVIHSQ